MVQRIEVEVVGDVSDLHTKLGQSEGKLGKFAGIGRKVAAGAALGLVGAGAAVAGFVGSSLRDLANVERINAQTASVIKSTGGAAGVSAAQVSGLAGRLERLTGTEAEATQEGQNLLLTFTNIRNEQGKGNQIFDRTTRAMVDMSRAMGSDTKASAVQLGKALNDPVKGVTALQKVGVSFNQQQKDTIKTLVESGRTMDAQKLILGELERQFGGSGKAYAKTTEGQIEIAKHAIGDLGETVAAGLLPLVGKVAGGITTLIDKGTAAWPRFSAGIRSGMAPVVPILTAIGGVVLSFMGRVRAAWSVVLRFASIIGARLAPILRQLAATIGGTVVPTIRRMAPTILRVAGTVGRFVGRLLVLAATLLGKVIPPVIRFAGFMFSRVFPALVRVVAGVVRVVAALVRFGARMASAGAAVARFAARVADRGASVVRFFVGLPGRITNAVGNVGKLLYGAGKSIIQGLLDGIGAMVGKLRSKLGSITKMIPDLKGPPAKDARLLRGAGELIIGGLIVGFDRKTPAVRRTLRALSREISGFGATPRQLAFDAIGPGNSASTARRRIITGTPGLTQTIRVKVRLTAQQLSRLERGREAVLDIAAYRKAGGRK